MVWWLWTGGVSHTFKIAKTNGSRKKVGVQKESKIYDPVQIKTVHAKQINQGTTWRQDNEDPPR